MIKIKDFYKPELVKGLIPFMKTHLTGKFDKYKAVIAIEKENTQYTGVNDEIVLRRALEFYSKEATVKQIYWFYSADIEQEELVTA